MIKSLLFCAALLVAGTSSAIASDYPSRPVRLIVNFPPAGPLDLEARAIAQHAGKLLGQTVVDVNIVVAAAAIGLATTLMVTIGVMLGRALGSVAGKRAEILGGMALMGIGAAILYEHLNAAAA